MVKCKMAWLAPSQMNPRRKEKSKTREKTEEEKKKTVSPLKTMGRKMEHRGKAQSLTTSPLWDDNDSPRQFQSAKD